METEFDEPQTDETTSVDDFCATLSATDRRVELIAAFHASEKRAGRNWATPSEYRKRFEDFLNTPVG